MIFARKKFSLLGLFFGCSTLGIQAENGSAICNDSLRYEVALNTVVSKGDFAPLWLNANRYGLSSVHPNNGMLDVALFRPSKSMGSSGRWSYAYGAEVAIAYDYTSPIIVQQAYVDINYKCWNLSIGAKERPMELKNKELSSGGLCFSANARPVPQVRIAINDYVPVIKGRNWLKMKGHLAYGRFVDDRWQRNFVSEGGRYAQATLYHSKAGFVRVGDEKAFPLTLELGLEMAAQFGGESYNAGYRVDDTSGKDFSHVKHGHGLEDFFHALIPSGSDVTDGAYSNVEGNHLGSWHGALTGYCRDWKLKFYFEHFFEDHSMMFWQYGWLDGMLGAEVTFPKNPWVSALVYECLGMKYQAGPVYHDHTDAIPDQISAMDNYYNHNLYAGWEHFGQSMGSPLLISPLYNQDGLLQFEHNRIVAHHVGVMGQPCASLQYKVLWTHNESWGTYYEPTPDVLQSNSMLVSVNYDPQRWKGWSFGVNFAYDHGSLLGNNTGWQFSVKREGWLSRSN